MTSLCVSYFSDRLAVVVLNLCGRYFFCIFYSGRVVESDTWYGPLAIFALVASTGLYICGEDKSHAGTYPVFLFLLAWLHYHTSFIISCIVHAHTLVSFF